MMDGGSLVCVKVLDGGTEAVWVCARAVYHVCPWLLYLGAHVCSSCLVLSCLVFVHGCVEGRRDILSAAGTREEHRRDCARMLC